MPAKVKLEQTAKFAEALARGERNRGRIARTALTDRLREIG